MRKHNGKKKFLYLFLFVIILIIVLTIIIIYSRDKRGFVIAGTRLEFSTRKEELDLFIDITKTIVNSNAYKGIVDIAISPYVPIGTDLPQGFNDIIYTYEIVFTDAKKERFTIKYPYLNMDYIVLFQVGNVQKYRVIWHARFRDKKSIMDL